jgi:hypothetical protein
LPDGPSAILCSTNLNIRALIPHEYASCVPLLRAKEETLWLAKLAKSLRETTADWLIRVYLGRDHETKKRNYHNRTIHGSMREAQAYLTKKTERA